jgi:hypothetical protein
MAIRLCRLVIELEEQLCTVSGMMLAVISELKQATYDNPTCLKDTPFSSDIFLASPPWGLLLTVTL